MSSFPNSCPVCGYDEFVSHDVLWPKLAKAWKLSENEVAYINRQQGLCCTSCQNNLRMMSLAQAVLHFYKSPGPLISAHDKINALDILEINRAGNLTPILETFSGHKLVEYPEIDMQKMDIESHKYDLVVHSDTLEHVKDPIQGLSECKRVLKLGGVCIFTVPVIVDRLSRSREGLQKSFHGSAEIELEDQRVWTEFGSDIWQTVIKAGFQYCEIFAFEYPSALVMICHNKNEI